jgi:hypothetical protein
VKDFHAAGRNAGIAALICAASFLLTAPPHCLAQRGGPGATAAGRRTDTLNRQGEQYERDHLGRDVKAPAASAGERRRAKDLAGQVRRDFEGLQSAYNKIVLAMAPGARPDPDSLMDSVAEVKRCAARLRDNLALPRVEKDGEDRARDAAGEEPLEQSLLKLRKHVYSFVTNPLFEAAPALDVKQAERAGRDLDIILGLSEAIRRSGGGSPKGSQH